MNQGGTAELISVLDRNYYSVMGGFFIFIKVHPANKNLLTEPVKMRQNTR